jgi:hypothetical protein
VIVAPCSRPSVVFGWAFVPVERVDSPNLHRKGLRRQSPVDAIEEYYVCLAVSCASARRWHPAARLVLFTPGDRPAWFERVRQRLAVEIVEQPFRHLPPDAESGRRFVGSTYTLDAADWISQQGSSEEVWILLDPDTVTLGPVDVERWTSLLGHLTWPLEARNPNNGLSCAKYQALRPVLGLRDSDEPIVVGGEFLAGSKDVFRRLSAEAARVWQVNLTLAADGDLPLKTEEHVLSMVLPTLPADDSRDVADRIWTAARYRTVNGTESRLLIWHLPSEKGRGFRRVLQAALDTSSWFWTAPRILFVEEVGRRMSVTERSPLRRARDWAGQLSQRLRSQSD